MCLCVNLTLRSDMLLKYPDIFNTKSKVFLYFVCLGVVVVVVVCCWCLLNVLKAEETSVFK